jgi:hypothetical protein
LAWDAATGQSNLSPGVSQATIRAGGANTTREVERKRSARRGELEIRGHRTMHMGIKREKDTDKRRDS